jgi:hypothetical protein
MARKQMKKSTTRTGRATPRKTTRARSTSPRAVVSKTVRKVQTAAPRPPRAARTVEGLGLGGLGAAVELDLSSLGIALGDLQTALRSASGSKAEEMMNNALSRIQNYAEELRHACDEGCEESQKAYDKAVGLLKKARDEGWEKARTVLEKLGVEIEAEETED